MSRSRITAFLVPLAIGVAVLAASWAADSDDAARPDTNAAVDSSVERSGDNTSDRSEPTSTVALSELPAEVTETWYLIEDDGPFPYERDGIVFGNFEGHLPRQQRGYYREFTVETPGIDHRGARRLVTGERGELYYTADHYDSFTGVDPDR